MCNANHNSSKPNRKIHQLKPEEICKLKLDHSNPLGLALAAPLDEAMSVEGGPLKHEEEVYEKTCSIVNQYSPIYGTNISSLQAKVISGIVWLAIILCSPSQNMLEYFFLSKRDEKGKIVRRSKIFPLCYSIYSKLGDDAKFFMTFFDVENYIFAHVSKDDYHALKLYKAKTTIFDWIQDIGRNEISAILKREHIFGNKVDPYDQPVTFTSYDDPDAHVKDIPDENAASSFKDNFGQLTKEARLSYDETRVLDGKVKGYNLTETSQHLDIAYNTVRDLHNSAKAKVRAKKDFFS